MCIRSLAGVGMAQEPTLQCRAAREGRRTWGRGRLGKAGKGGREGRQAQVGDRGQNGRKSQCDPKEVGLCLAKKLNKGGAETAPAGGH